MSPIRGIENLKFHVQGVHHVRMRWYYIASVTMIGQSFEILLRIIDKIAKQAIHFISGGS